MLHHTAVARWDTGKLLRIIRSISVGVNFLHTTQPAVLHRDLKPGNIFVDTGQVRGDSSLRSDRVSQQVSCPRDDPNKPVSAPLPVLPSRLFVSCETSQHCHAAACAATSQ